MNKKLMTFVILMVCYIFMVFMLCILEYFYIVDFNSNLDNGLENLLTSLPLVAFYLLVLIAALAGYARGAIMADKLPFNILLQEKLKQKNLEHAGIKAKIRSGKQIYTDTSLAEFITNINSSRISILAVIDKNDGKVQGVVTSHDILDKLQEEISKDSEISLTERLQGITADELCTREVVAVKPQETLGNVIDTIIKHQLTKLIVINEDDTFSGTIDALDLISELIDDNGEEN